MTELQSNTPEIPVDNQPAGAEDNRNPKQIWRDVQELKGNLDGAIDRLDISHEDRQILGAQLDAITQGVEMSNVGCEHLAALQEAYEQLRSFESQMSKNHPELIRDLKEQAKAEKRQAEERGKQERRKENPEKEVTPKSLAKKIKSQEKSVRYLIEELYPDLNQLSPEDLQAFAKQLDNPDLIAKLEKTSELYADINQNLNKLKVEYPNALAYFDKFVSSDRISGPKTALNGSLAYLLIDEPAFAYDESNVECNKLKDFKFAKASFCFNVFEQKYPNKTDADALQESVKNQIISSMLAFNSGKYDVAIQGFEIVAKEIPELKDVFKKAEQSADKDSESPEAQLMAELEKIIPEGLENRGELIGDLQDAISSGKYSRLPSILTAYNLEDSSKQALLQKLYTFDPKIAEVFQSVAKKFDKGKIIDALPGNPASGEIIMGIQAANYSQIEKALQTLNQEERLRVLAAMPAEVVANLSSSVNGDQVATAGL